MPRENMASQSRLAEDLTELINLEAINHLPKATEHFISDLHGEFEAFDHLMRNCSGIIRIKISQIFDGLLTQTEQKQLAFTIYYPEYFIQAEDYRRDEWLILLNRLVRVTRHVSSKYTRSKVRKALPESFAYILEELLYQYDQEANKQKYYDAIFNSIIDLGLAGDFAVAIARLIQGFVVDHLHVLGDIYDRGPGPDLIMDRLMTSKSLDIQIGNHDVIWLGAFSGSLACLAIILRITLRYGHLDLLQEAYEIDLTRLKKFAQRHYEDNPAFRPRGMEPGAISESQAVEIAQMHQAISMIQFKLEGQIIQRRPEFKMEDRLLLDKLTEDGQAVTIDGKDYSLEHTCFDTLDPEAPYELTLGEELIILDLQHQLQRSSRLKEHMDFLMEKGSMYTCYNGNLLFHGCIPCTASGKFMPVNFQQGRFAGKDLMDYYQEMLELAYANPKISDDYATDVVWYLWCGEGSTLFGKKSMKTFERYFVTDKETHKEVQNAYYELRDSEDFAMEVLGHFGLDTTGYIINGHTPVKAMAGENPIKAGGKLLVIDGGLSTAYQKITGIAGYTLVDNSNEVYLVAHHSFESREKAIQDLIDILPQQKIVYKRPNRTLIKETDVGCKLTQEIEAIKAKWPRYFKSETLGDVQ